MVLKKSEIVPYEITGGLETVAIRMPSHKTAARLIRESGLYIAAPSANTSGRPSPTKARYVVEDLDGRVDMIICDDTVDIGIESTIVDLSEGVPTILRPGYITMEMLQEVLGRVELDKAIEGANLITGNVVPKAPGMKYRHYAPKASLTLVEGEDEAVWQAICGLVEKAGVEGVAAAVMTTDENADRYRERFPGLAVKSLGSRDDQATVARRLFAVLREFDDLNVDRIYSESFPSDNVGQAIMNRLLKAAGHGVLKV
jgi:L-threonylcarbamoyladenylate synthase